MEAKPPRPTSRSKRGIRQRASKKMSDTAWIAEPKGCVLYLKGEIDGKYNILLDSWALKNYVLF